MNNKTKFLIFCFFDLFMCEHPHKHFNLASSWRSGTTKERSLSARNLEHMIHPKVLFKQSKKVGTTYLLKSHFVSVARFVQDYGNKL